jgi:hypothetical protein
MGYKFFCDLSHVAGSSNRGKAAAHINYILRAGECLSYVASVEGDKADLKSAWRGIERAELQRRKDARFQSRLIVSLPNQFDRAQVNEVMSEIQAILRGHHFVCALHAGQSGQGGENLHLHCAFSDRDIITGKKTREMIKKDWLQSTQTRIKSRIAGLLDVSIATIENPDNCKRGRVSQGAYRAGVRYVPMPEKTISADEALLKILAITERAQSAGTRANVAVTVKDKGDAAIAVDANSTIKGAGESVGTRANETAVLTAEAEPVRFGGQQSINQELKKSMMEVAKMGKTTVFDNVMQGAIYKSTKPAKQGAEPIADDAQKAEQRLKRTVEALQYLCQRGFTTDDYFREKASILAEKLSAIKEADTRKRAQVLAQALDACFTAEELIIVEKSIQEEKAAAEQTAKRAQRQMAAALGQGVAQSGKKVIEGDITGFAIAGAQTALNGLVGAVEAAKEEAIIQSLRCVPDLPSENTV